VPNIAAALQSESYRTRQMLVAIGKSLSRMMPKDRQAIAADADIPHWHGDSRSRACFCAIVAKEKAHV